MDGWMDGWIVDQGLIDKEREWERGRGRGRGRGTTEGEAHVGR